jgi:pentatricopeptide repeat protein
MSIGDCIGDSMNNCRCQSHDHKQIRSQSNTSLEPFYVTGSQVTARCKEGNVDAALTIYTSKPDPLGATSLITLFGKENNIDQAWKVYQTLLESKEHKPNPFVYNALLSACKRCGQYEQSIRLLNDMEKYGVNPDELGFRLLIGACVQTNDVETAKKLVEKVTSQEYTVALDAYHCTRLLQIFAKEGRMSDAANMLEFMNQLRVVPDEVTFMVLLTGCSNAKDLAFGKKVHSLISKHIQTPDLMLENALLNMYTKCNDMRAAQSLFDQFQKKRENLDAVAWNTMITGYVSNGQHEKAVELFRAMQQDTKPTSVTYNAMFAIGQQNKKLAKELEDEVQY